MRPVSDYVRLAGHVMDHHALYVYEPDSLLSNTGHVQNQTSITQVTFMPPHHSQLQQRISRRGLVLYQGTQEMETAKGTHHPQFYMAMTIVY